MHALRCDAKTIVLINAMSSRVKLGVGVGCEQNSLFKAVKP